MVKIKKRNGELTDFNGEKIITAISKAMKESDEYSNDIAIEIEDEVKAVIECKNDIVEIDEIQNLIEDLLMEYGLKRTAKNYILFRAERDKVRDKKPKYKFLSNEFLSKYKHLDPFKHELGKFVYLRTYSRPLPKEGRREIFLETVARTVDYNVGLAKWTSHERAVREAEELFDNIYNLRQFPSGRALWSAGELPSIINPISQYNCSFSAFDNFDILKDIAYLLMLGVGFGFSVEKQYVDNLPKVRGDITVVHKSYSPIKKANRKEATEFNIVGDIMEIIVGDSKIGWSNALDFFIKAFYQLDYSHVNAVIINYDNVRPFNEPLKTFGGKASGHTALQIMLEKIEKILKYDNPQKKKLKPIDCMDIANIVAEGIVVGGTRRSAEATLISVDDVETQQAKLNLYKQNNANEWVVDESILHRMMSNNSTTYWEKPSFEELKNRFEIIKQSAENNFFNMKSASKRKPNVKGTNPLTI